ncbi:MAG TPA: magnesium transporter [Stenotrophobium sp.]|nr:magnesium transporter [Stenotrophobium sp.]
MAKKSDEKLPRLLKQLRARAPMDAAQLLARQTPERIEEALQALPPALAQRLRQHLPSVAQTPLPHGSHPHVVGEMMEPASGVLPPQTTAAEAIAWLRSAERTDEMTYLYVVDAQNRLQGLVVMRDLMLAQPEQTLEMLMLRQPFSLRVDQPLAEAAHDAIKRHYPVYPVCDAGTLVGLVRGWRLLEHQMVEISAQSGRMVGVTGEEDLETPVWAAFRMRHPWLQLNLLTAFMAAFVVGSFADTISRIVALAVFLPVLSSQSANTGCQALAITLRGFAFGDILRQPVLRLFTKEIALGALNGLMTGAIAGAAMWWTAAHGGNPHAPMLALVVLVAMVVACSLSGVSGVVVPLLLKRFDADPATASSIFLTTITDIASMGLMLGLAAVLVR